MHIWKMIKPHPSRSVDIISFFLQARLQDAAGPGRPGTALNAERIVYVAAIVAAINAIVYVAASLSSTIPG